jgi:phosphomannomutase
MINASVFKAYDVRGLYPSEITEELFHQLGRAFVAYLGPGNYAVTRDMRVSSPSLTKAFIDGTVKQGGNVIDYGLVGTDQMYYAVAADDLDGGAQVTASHNPGEYNGCKLVRKEAFPLSGEAGIKEMKEMILAGSIPAPPAKAGSVERRDIMDR